MTHEENIHFQILERLIINNKSLLSPEEYNELVKGIEGAATHRYMFETIKNKGYIYFSGGYVTIHPGYTEWKVLLTDVGKGAYEDFKTKKRNSTIQKIAFWVLFVASLVSAVYAVIGYHFTDKTKSPPVLKEEIKKVSPITTLPQIKKTDTTKVLKTGLSDTPKNN